MQLKITNKNKTKQRNNNINTMKNRRGEDGRGWGWVGWLKMLLLCGLYGWGVWARGRGGDVWRILLLN